MTSQDSTGIRRRGIALVAATALAAIAVTGAARADEVGVPIDPAARFADGPIPADPGSRAAETLRAATGATDGGLLLEDGRFRPLPDVSGALGTVHVRLNNRGDIVGVYADDGAGAPRLRGFLLREGRFTRIDVPGAMFTLPVGINDRGQVVGGYVEPGATVDPVSGEYTPAHRFLWDRGRFTKFDIPGALTTAPYDINDRGQIVGNYTDADAVQHGFVRRRGAVTTIDAPGATDVPGLTGTRVTGINDRGELVGGYRDDAGRFHAYRYRQGAFTEIAPRGALGAEATGINNRGQVVGRYLTAQPKLLGFLQDGGRVSTIDAGEKRCDTAAYEINDRGQILIPAAGTIDGTTCPGESRRDVVQPASSAASRSL